MGSEPDTTATDHLAEAWAYVDGTPVPVSEAARIAGTSEILIRNALETGALASLRTRDVMLYRDRQREIAADMTEIYAAFGEADGKGP